MASAGPRTILAPGSAWAVVRPWLMTPRARRAGHRRPGLARAKPRLASRRLANPRLANPRLANRCRTRRLRASAIRNRASRRPPPGRPWAPPRCRQRQLVTDHQGRPLSCPRPPRCHLHRPGTRRKPRCRRTVRPLRQRHGRHRHRPGRRADPRSHRPGRRSHHPRQLGDSLPPSRPPGAKRPLRLRPRRPGDSPRQHRRRGVRQRPRDHPIRTGSEWPPPASARAPRRGVRWRWW